MLVHFLHAQQIWIEILGLKIEVENKYVVNILRYLGIQEKMQSKEVL